MKKFRRYLKGLRLSYYSLMMSICAENNEAARVAHGEDSDEAYYWVRRYDLYSIKYDKTLMKTV